MEALTDELLAIIVRSVPQLADRRGIASASKGIRARVCSLVEARTTTVRSADFQLTAVPRLFPKLLEWYLDLQQPCDIGPFMAWLHASPERDGRLKVTSASFVSVATQLAASLPCDRLEVSLEFRERVDGFEAALAKLGQLRVDYVAGNSNTAAEVAATCARARRVHFDFLDGIYPRPHPPDFSTVTGELRVSFLFADPSVLRGADRISHARILAGQADQDALIDRLGPECQEIYLHPLSQNYAHTARIVRALQALLRRAPDVTVSIWGTCAAAMYSAVRALGDCKRVQLGCHTLADAVVARLLQLLLPDVPIHLNNVSDQNPVAGATLERLRHLAPEEAVWAFPLQLGP